MREKLFDRDWHSLMSAIQRICSTTDIDTLQSVSLECLRAIIPSDQSVFLISKSNSRTDLCRPAIRGVDAYYIDEFLAGSFDNEEDSELFFSGKHILCHDTETTRDSDEIPEDYLMSTKIYNEMYAKQNIHYAVRSSLVYRRRFIGTLESFNSKARGDFTDKQLQMQSLLAPHIANHLGVLMTLLAQAESTPVASAASLRNHYNLTLREAEIISLLSGGTQEEEIIATLCISPSTFKKHLYNAYRKMGVSSRSQLYNKLYGSNMHAKANK